MWPDMLHLFSRHVKQSNMTWYVSRVNHFFLRRSATGVRRAPTMWLPLEWRIFILILNHQLNTMQGVDCASWLLYKSCFWTISQGMVHARPSRALARHEFRQTGTHAVQAQVVTCANAGLDFGAHYRQASSTQPTSVAGLLRFDGILIVLRALAGCARETRADACPPGNMPMTCNKLIRRFGISTDYSRSYKVRYLKLGKIQ